jgi:long-chain fatty acid transport protein
MPFHSEYFMHSLKPCSQPVSGLVLFTLVTIASPALAQYGPVFSAAGPVSRSMGGTSTAAPLSASGALLWNPATLAAFERSQLDVGAELLFPTTSLSSRIPAGALGADVPATDLAGTTRSEPTAFALPTIALAYRPDDSRFTYGFGLFAVTGFGLNYAGSTTNPLLNAPPPTGFGLGPVMAQYQALQIAPALVYHATDRWSVSASPLVNLGYLQLDPLLVAAPDDANMDTFASYPNGTHSRAAWGGGYGLGTYFQGDIWGVGASYKSTQWFQSYEFNTSDELGNPRTAEFDLDLPSTVSVGLAYRGFEYILIATDLRYIDFEHTDGYDKSGYAADGSLLGIGFENTFVVSLGTQLTLTEALLLRIGYSYNDSPIPSDQATANAASPVIIEHQLGCGFSYQATPDLMFSAAYVHAFENALRGPIILPSGTIPGGTIENTASIELVSFGATVAFGPRR